MRLALFRSVSGEGLVPADIDRMEQPSAESITYPSQPGWSTVVTGHHATAKARAARRRRQCPKAARNARSKLSAERAEH